MIEEIIIFLEPWGVLDSILPFILLGIIFFTILRLVNLFILKKYWKELKSKIVILASIVLSLIYVLPHILGIYPAMYDLVDIFNILFKTMAFVTILCILINTYLWYINRKNNF